MQGIFLIITAPVLATNLLADGPYVLLDLRVRQGRHSLTVPWRDCQDAPGDAHGNAFGGIGCHAVPSSDHSTPRDR